MQPMVLKLSASGLPDCWLNLQEAVTEMTADRVLYSFGSICHRLYGGINRHGERSFLDVPQILVGRGVRCSKSGVPALSNRTLFARDRHICMYCGRRFPTSQLSRDHVIPTSRGGKDEWTNVVTACRRCNHHKAAHLLDECGMELVAVPYTPNRHEYLYLSNHRILHDQMNYLQQGFRHFRA